MTGPRRRVILWDRAAREIEEASDWWRTNRQGSPEALSDELVRAFDLISMQPGVGIPALRRLHSPITRGPTGDRPSW